MKERIKKEKNKRIIKYIYILIVKMKPKYSKLEGAERRNMCNNKPKFQITAQYYLSLFKRLKY